MNLVRSIATVGGYTMASALDELYGLGYQIIDTEDALYEAVTVTETRDVARKYLKADELVVVVVQPEKAG